jgi:DNA-binding CsgD family transcriptional regulator
MDIPDDGSANATELAHFLDTLNAAKGVDDRWNHLTRFMGDHGADVINYAVLNTLEFSRAEASVTQFSNMSSDWIEHYLAQRLDLHDPHVRYAREGGVEPYRWDERRTGFLTSEDGRNVLSLAAEAGLRSQISMVAPDPSGRGEPIGGMTIGSSLHDGEYFRAIAGKEAMLISAAMLYHHSAIGEIRRHQVSARPLSPRERDCMTYVASGLRTARIAEKMHISEVTVDMHLRNAREKLRARTTAQAVARAMIFGDIEI